MSLWQKLNTLFKASAQEPLQALVDANDLRIFAQELRDARQAMGCAKKELACVIAEKTRLERHNQALRENIANREVQAKQALQQPALELAQELAELIADDEQILQQQEQQLACLKKQESQLRKQLKQVARMIASYHAELKLARANQSAETAARQLRGYSRGLTTQMSAMDDSLRRIKQRQEHFQDYDAALHTVEAEFNGDALTDKLKAAGINHGKPDAEAVLSRLKGESCAPNPC